MKRGMVSVLLVLIILSSSIIPAYANSAPMRNDGTPSTGVLSIDKNCPITVEAEQLEFDLREVDQNSGFGGKVTATYEMKNPTDQDLSVKMAFPYVTSLKNLQGSSITVSKNEQALPFDVYCSYENTRHADLNDRFMDRQLDINHIINTIHPDDVYYKPKNFTLDQMGYLYKFEFDSTDVILTLENNDSRVIFDRFTQEIVQEKRNCYRPYKTSGHRIFSFAGPVDFSVAWKEGHAGEGAPQYKVEVEQISAVEYLEKYQAPQVSEHYGYPIKNATSYCISVLDQQLANSNKAVDREWIFWDELNIHVILLVYQVDFKAGETCSVSVMYPTILAKDKLSKGIAYEEMYLLNPARYWAAFGKLDITVKTPSFAPYVLAGEAEFAEIQPGIYTSSFDTLPSGNLRFSIYHQRDLQLKEETEYIMRKWANNALFLLLLGSPVIFPALFVIVVVKGISTARKRSKK